MMAAVGGGRTLHSREWGPSSRGGAGWSQALIGSGPCRDQWPLATNKPWSVRHWRITPFFGNDGHMIAPANNWVDCCRSAIMAVGLMAVSGTSLASLPPPLPVLKKGSCPVGYRTAAAYCLPLPSARFAIERLGQCPPGYSASTNFCLAQSGAAYAMPKVGACPPGYRTAGPYCLELGN